MQITSLNGWGGRLYENSLSYLAASQPDVLCLQEVVHTPDSTGAVARSIAISDRPPAEGRIFSRRFREILPRPRRRLLSNRAGRAVARKRAGSRRNGGWRPSSIGRSRSSPRVQGFVHGTFSPVRLWRPSPFPECARDPRFLISSKGFPVTIAHMHGLRDPGGKHDTPARLAQAERLKTILFGPSPWTETVIVICGDFNVFPDSQTFVLAVREMGLTDLVTTRGFTSTRTSHYRKEGRVRGLHAGQRPAGERLVRSRRTARSVGSPPAGCCA